MTEQRDDLRTTDGVIDCHTFQPDGVGSWPAVLVYMDAFGIRPDLASMAQRLASNGYVVTLPNLYYRTGTFEPFHPPRVLSDPAERSRFKAMIGSITDTMVMRDTAVVLQHLDRMASVRKGAMGAAGYCMGGGFALSAAGTFPDRITVAASFHGGSLATEKGDSPHRLARQMRGRVYIGVAGDDPSFTQEQQQRLEQALRDAAVDYTLETYADAKHGFAVTGHQAYDHDASERHWRTLLRLLKAAL